MTALALGLRDTESVPLSKSVTDRILTMIGGLTQ